MNWLWIWSHVFAALVGFGLGIAWALFLDKAVNKVMEE